MSHLSFWLCDTHGPLKCGLSLPGILSSLWQAQLFLATKALVSGAGESSAPQEHVSQQSHSMQAATSQVLVPVTGLLVHPLTTGQHLDWICREKKKQTQNPPKKPSCHFVCSPNISSHPPISKKREGNDRRKSPCQHKAGVKSPGLEQHCCHFTPQTLQGPTGGTPQPPGLPTPLHSLAILHLHPGDVGPRVRVSSPSIRAGDEPGSETAGHTFYSWTWAQPQRAEIALCSLCQSGLLLSLSLLNCSQYGLILCKSQISFRYT